MLRRFRANQQQEKAPSAAPSNSGFSAQPPASPLPPPREELKYRNLREDNEEGETSGGENLEQQEEDTKDQRLTS